MVYNRKGDFGAAVGSFRRVNQDFNTETITGPKTLLKNCQYWQNISAASAQDVFMPDATTLSPGWCVVVLAAGAGTLTVKKSGATAIHTVASGKAYEFTLTDNATAAGTWNVDFKNPIDSVPSVKYVKTMNATTDWGAASGGYYSIQVTAATHGVGTQPFVQIEETSGSDTIRVDVDEVKINSSGDIAIRVPEVPDLRFAGRILVM